MQGILQKCRGAATILPLFYQPTARHWQQPVQFSALKQFTSFYKAHSNNTIPQGTVSQTVVCVPILAGQPLPTGTRS